MLTSAPAASATPLSCNWPDAGGLLMTTDLKPFPSLTSLKPKSASLTT